MYSSYQNTSNIKSKLNNIIQQSDYIIDDNDLPSHNKQNYSIQFNKSNYSQMNKSSNSYQFNKSNNNHFNKSNHSNVSNLKDKSGLMGSKSVSLIMAQSKIKHSLIPVQQDNYLAGQKSKMSQNRSLLKSYNNKNYHKQQYGPSLKVLTQSDLTQNYENDSNNIFSDSQQYNIVPKSHIKQNKQSLQHYSQRKNQSQFKINSNKRQNYIKQPQNYNQVDQSYENQQQQVQQVETPPFTFIPSQKLQIKYFTLANKQLISLSDLLSLIPHNINTLKTVKKLSITNCSLNNLQGIQLFQNLQQINFRQNQLRQVQQLYRIKNKSLIFSINLLGNDIQHFHMARYQNLIQYFPNLIDLNDKNYAMMKKKQHGDMKKIIKKSTKIQYQLRKTLRKQTKRTDRAILKLHPQLLTDQQTQRTHQNHHQASDNKLAQRQQYSYQNDYTSTNRYNNSVSRRSTSQIKSPTYKNCSATSFTKKRQIDDQNDVYQIQQSNLNPNSYSLGQSSKQKEYNKTVNKNNTLRQVSLGNLQNVPITKSVKYQQKSSNKQTERSPNKYKNNENKQNMNNQNLSIPLQTGPMTTVNSKNMLQIRTQDLDNESQLAGHLHQPTATFAMQKQRQQQCTNQNKQFMFKNKKSSNQNNQFNSNNQYNKTKSFKQLKDQQQIYQQYQNDEDDNQMSLSRISKISQIPTKRLSHNRKSNLSNFKYQHKSRYQNYQNASEQSFMTGNQFNNNNNQSYIMGFSQFSQYRPNQSMDQDCLLKDNKNGIQQQKIAIATAVYMQNLIRKSLYALIKEGSKRKNLPKKRPFF